MRLRMDAAAWVWHSWGGVDWAALMVHLTWGNLRHGIEVACLVIGAFGVCLAAWGAVAQICQRWLFRAVNRDGRGVYWAWDLLVCLMWGVCGIDWAVMGVRGSNDPFGGTGF